MYIAANDGTLPDWIAYRALIEETLLGQTGVTLAPSNQQISDGPTRPSGMGTTGTVQILALRNGRALLIVEDHPNLLIWDRSNPTQFTVGPALPASTNNLTCGVRLDDGSVLLCPYGGASTGTQFLRWTDDGAGGSLRPGAECTFTSTTDTASAPRVGGAVLHPDGYVYVASGRGPQLGRYNVDNDTFEVVRTLNYVISAWSSNPVGALAVLRNGKMLMVGRHNLMPLNLIDITVEGAGSVRSDLANGIVQSDALILSADGSQVFIPTRNGTVYRTFYEATETVVNGITMGVAAANGIIGGALLQTGHIGLAPNTDTQLRIANLATGAVSAAVDLASYGAVQGAANCTAIGYVGDGEYLITTNAAIGKMLRWKPYQTGTPLPEPIALGRYHNRR